MLNDYLKNKGINVVEVVQLTKQEVVEQVRTLTFRVAIKASDYEAALKPEIWPYRVGVRHYRAPRRERPDSSWNGQSGRSGGNIAEGDSGQDSAQGRGGHQPHKQHLPPGHPGRAPPNQQTMGAKQKMPVEVSNFFQILSRLGGEMGPP